MSQLGVGKEVLSHCNKCKLTLAHIIVTMKTQTLADKVQCKTCKGTHAFKDPSAKAKTPSRVLKMVKTTNSLGKRTETSVLELWTRAMSKANGDAKTYSTKESFQINDIIDHPTFGHGVVERLIDNNKIEVIFKDDYRTLLHQK